MTAGTHPKGTRTSRARSGLKWLGAASVAGLMLIGSGEAQVRDSSFRDLNHNGRMDPYENAKLTAQQRVADLVARMTLEEKVGAMLHGTLPTAGSAIGVSQAGYDRAAVTKLVGENHVTSMITRLSISPEQFAQQNNMVQEIAAQTRLGIPVTISTDPRNHFQVVVGASSRASGFSQWPETLGLAAIGDPALVRRFGAIVAREYRAVGITMALSPQADLATEPRWSRGTGTFGSDPVTVSNLARAYVQGFQGSDTGLRTDGVATVVKHWVGYGAEPEGFDGHNHYGRVVRLDNKSFALHVRAFDGALAAGAAGVMPTYPIVSGVTIAGKPMEQVGAGYNSVLLNGLLRKTHGYRGLIVSDWGITSTCDETCMNATKEAPQKPTSIAMDWGVDKLSEEDRFAKGARAGIDQFGGVNNPAPLLAAVRAGKISMARVNDAVSRVMLLKFRLGLFDNPFVDPARAAGIIGEPSAIAAAEAAQRTAQVLLENRATLPLAQGKRVWAVGMDPAAVRAAGLTPVDSPEAAEAAIIRVGTPFETLHPYHFFGRVQHEGRLDFRDGNPGYEAIKRAAGLPTVVAVDMDRPAILTNIRDKASAILAVFGASDAAVLDVVTGRAQAKGRLPFELPRSMAEVEAQDPALPDDTRNPLYPRGAGM